MDAGVDVTHFTQYSVTSHFLTPADAFSFTVGDHALSQETKDALTLGARVRLTVNASVLLDGHIDEIEIDADRSSGVVYKISGRDRLGLAVDSLADPTVKFKASQTLEDALRTLFADFGWND